MKRTLILFLLLCFLSAQLTAQKISIPRPQDPPKLVNDFDSIMSATEREWLEDKLVAYDKESSTQICIITIDSLHGSDIAELATDIGNTWGVGRAGKHNGVIILAAIADRRITIAPGYGLEKTLTDVNCREIIDLEITPSFKDGWYYKGFEKGADAIIAVTKGTYKHPGKYGASRWSMPRWLIITLLILGINGGIIGIVVLFNWLMEKLTGKKYRGRTASYWTASSYENTTTGNSSSFSSSDYSSGSSKDSFEGYGGGKFGGGGASGSW